MKFLHSNETIYRLLRTILQGIIGVIIANIDLITGQFAIPEVWKPIIVAICMAILSPVMAEIGKKNDTDTNNTDINDFKEN